MKLVILLTCILMIPSCASRPRNNAPARTIDFLQFDEPENEGGLKNEGGEPVHFVFSLQGSCHDGGVWYSWEEGLEIEAVERNGKRLLPVRSRFYSYGRSRLLVPAPGPSFVYRVPARLLGNHDFEAHEVDYYILPIKRSSDDESLTTIYYRIRCANGTRSSLMTLNGVSLESHLKSGIPLQPFGVPVQP